jgi:phosphoglycerate dehydrogenase-like enzyme
MKTLNVLIMTPSFDRSSPHADNDVIRAISEAGPGIKVIDGSPLLTAELRGDNTRKAELDAMLAKTDIMFGFVPPAGVTVRAPNLKWFQATSAGVDRHIDTEIWKSAVIITGASGIHATPIGEFVMGLMLMFAKNTPQGFKMMQTHRYERYASGTLRGKTVGIVGLGHIGGEVARLSKAFGMKVTGTRRSAKKPGKARNVDLVLPTSQMKEMLKQSDYVAVCCPLTPETRHIINEAALKAMKPTAIVMNIGRGDLIDEAALVRALKEKRIGGAGLDVTSQEPLPSDSPLWGLDNVILSPHVSGGMEDYMLRAAQLFAENLRRYIAGKKLLNRVNRKRGY